MSNDSAEQPRPRWKIALSWVVVGLGLAVGIDNHSALVAYEKAHFSRVGLPRFESPFGEAGPHTVIYMTASTRAHDADSRATA